MFKKLLITGGIALAGYVINEVRKQYDKNVNDYNALVDRYNESVFGNKNRLLFLVCDIGNLGRIA